MGNDAGSPSFRETRSFLTVSVSIVTLTGEGPDPARLTGIVDPVTTPLGGLGRGFHLQQGAIVREPDYLAAANFALEDIGAARDDLAGRLCLFTLEVFGALPNDTHPHHNEDNHHNS